MAMVIDGSRSRAGIREAHEPVRFPESQMPTRIPWPSRWPHAAVRPNARRDAIAGAASRPASSGLTTAMHDIRMLFHAWARARVPDVRYGPATRPI